MQEYLKHANGTRAASRAGYAPSSAAVHAHRLLKNDAVRTKIRDYQNILQQIVPLDFGSLFDAEANLLPPHKMPKEVRRALGCFESQEPVKGGRPARTSQRVKVPDKLATLNILAKHIILFHKEPI